MYKSAHKKRRFSSSFNLKGVTRPVKKNLLWRFEKAEMAGLGILLFVFFFFPLAIFLSALAGFGAFKYWKHTR